VETSNHTQHRCRSSWFDDSPSPAQPPDRSELVAKAVLPRERMRLLRDQPARMFACSTLAARNESITSSGAITNFHQKPRSMQAESGLAAWQQLVITAYIEKRISESIAVRALARFVYLSSSRFRRAFKQSFGIPPHRYVVQRRIERAKALLASSAWSITEISLALGFSQPGSLSAAFRNVTGITPTEYRRTRGWLKGVPKGV
jgi:AraC-like DNA-binding protein